MKIFQFVFSAANSSLANQKRKMEGDIHQMQADLDNMLAQSKSAEEKAKKAMVDAGRLADELRAEQDHTNAQDKVRRAIGTLCLNNNKSRIYS